jgi:hypothetical protein
VRVEDHMRDTVTDPPRPGHGADRDAVVAAERHHEPAGAEVPLGRRGDALHDGRRVESFERQITGVRVGQILEVALQTRRIGLDRL